LPLLQDGDAEPPGRHHDLPQPISLLDGIEERGESVDGGHSEMGVWAVFPVEDGRANAPRALVALPEHHAVVVASAVERGLPRPLRRVRIV
jgi:hypothetical protein